MKSEYEHADEGIWTTVERPGYFGKKRAEMEERWDKKHGEGNWRVAWETPTGETMTFDDVFEEYIWGYVKYFKGHPDEANYLTENFSYAYDKDLISIEEAFNPYTLYNKKGVANQFHHVALNIALQHELDYVFSGDTPIKVRAGKPDAPKEEWPEGWKWHPGLIPCANPDLIKDVDIPERWWEKGSIEDLYQSNKVIQVRH